MKRGRILTENEQNVLRVFAAFLLSMAIVFTAAVYRKSPEASLVPTFMLVFPCGLLNFIVWRLKMVW